MGEKNEAQKALDSMSEDNARTAAEQHSDDDVADGRANYQGYGDAVGWVNHAGGPIPAWDDLGDKIRNGWIAGADAVRARERADG